MRNRDEEQHTDIQTLDAFYGARRKVTILLVTAAFIQGIALGISPLVYKTNEVRHNGEETDAICHLY